MNCSEAYLNRYSLAPEVIYIAILELVNLARRIK